MTHSGIFATSDEILVKAGKDYNVLITEARINALCLQAESFINCATKYNWSDAYSTLNVDVKYILSQIESDLVAMYMISFDMSVFYTRDEALNMIEFLRDRSEKTLTILQDLKNQDFMINA